MECRLGSVYYYQRPYKMYCSHVGRLRDGGAGGEKEKEEEGFVCLTPNDRLARSPRFSSTTTTPTSSPTATTTTTTTPRNYSICAIPNDSTPTAAS